jgi:hypothetical protein
MLPDALAFSKRRRAEKATQKKKAVADYVATAFWISQFVYRFVSMVTGQGPMISPGRMSDGKIKIVTPLRQT